MNDAATKTERNSYPSMKELEARRLGLPIWAAAKKRIAAWGKRMGVKRVHVVDPATMLRLETIDIP